MKSELSTMMNELDLWLSIFLSLGTFGFRNIFWKIDALEEELPDHMKSGNIKEENDGLLKYQSKQYTTWDAPDWKVLLWDLWTSEIESELLWCVESSDIKFQYFKAFFFMFFFLVCWSTSSGIYLPGGHI